MTVLMCEPLVGSICETSPTTQRVIILAGGSARRWGNYLGVPKHLAPIPDGHGGTEPLLHRTVRQLNANGQRQINIIGPDDDRYRIPGTTWHLTRWRDKQTGIPPWLDWTHLWDGAQRTVVLLGDVYWTDAALRLTLLPREDWTFFARLTGSTVTGCPWGEDFGCGFWPAHRLEFASALHHVQDLYNAKRVRRAGSWEAWQVMCGVLDDQIQVPPRLGPLRRHIDIPDDGTDDLDYPDDYNRFQGVTT